MLLYYNTHSAIFVTRHRAFWQSGIWNVNEIRIAIIARRLEWVHRQELCLALFQHHITVRINDLPSSNC